MLLANTLRRVANIFHPREFRNNRVRSVLPYVPPFRHMTAEAIIRRIDNCRAQVARDPRAPRRRRPRGEVGPVPEILPCPAPIGTSRAQSGPTRAGWSAGCQASSTAAAGPWRRRCCHCRCRPDAYCWRGIRSRRRPAGRCDSGTRGCSYPPLWHHKTGWAPSFHDTAAITATSLPSRSTPRVLSGRTMYFDRPRRKRRQLLRMRTQLRSETPCGGKVRSPTALALSALTAAARRAHTSARRSLPEKRKGSRSVSQHGGLGTRVVSSLSTAASASLHVDGSAGESYRTACRTQFSRGHLADRYIRASPEIRPFYRHRRTSFTTPVAVVRCDPLTQVDRPLVFLVLATRRTAAFHRDEGRPLAHPDW